MKNLNLKYDVLEFLSKQIFRRNLKFQKFRKNDSRDFFVIQYFRMDTMIMVDEEKKKRILNELDQMQQNTNWNQMGKAETVADAIQEIKSGKDIGWHNTWLLQPQSDCHHAWMEFAFLITLIYNRDATKKRYTILRIWLFY